MWIIVLHVWYDTTHSTLRLTGSAPSTAGHGHWTSSNSMLLGLLDVHARALGEKSYTCTTSPSHSDARLPIPVSGCKSFTSGHAERHWACVDKSNVAE